MPGTRQALGPVRARSILALSVLALLALGAFPVLAHADSSGIQYSDAPPTVNGGHTIPTQTESGKHSSKKSGGADASEAPGSGGSGGGGSAGGSSPGSGGGAATGTGAGQQGSQGQGAGNGGSGNLSQNAQGGSEPASSQDDGGSSPLVPILIAIAALAAISIGAVVMQRRRRDADDSGTSVSPKAS